MFTKSARFYDAIYSFKEYEKESHIIHETIQRYNQNAGKTLLDIACGTAKHLEYLQTHYQAMGVDLLEDQLVIARQRCPDIPFQVADMRDFDLGQTFDSITCLFSSIGYVHTTETLSRTIANFARHLNPGGTVLVEPWFTPDVIEPGRIASLFINEPDLRIARMNRMEVNDRISRMVFHYLIGTPESIEHFTENHEMWMFTDEEYRAAFQMAGLTLVSEETDLSGRGLYVAQKLPAGEDRG